jgi:hypothetical protein
LFLGIVFISSARDKTSFVCAQHGEWSSVEPLLDFGVHDEMAVAVDATQHIHALWIQGDALFYSRWDGQEWTIPMDVIARSSTTILRWPSIAAGPTGEVYACWQEQSMLSCSYAIGGDPVNPRNWSSVNIVSHDPAMHSDLEADSDGNLHLVYSVAGGDVFYRYSDDQGITWSFPVNVSFRPSGILTDYPRLSIDLSGGLHIVWTDLTTPNGVPVLGTFYTRSLDGGEIWEQPIEVTSGWDYAEINVLAIGENQIHLAWNGRAGFGGRYHQWSNDRGLTWYPVSEVILRSAQGGGKTGPPDMAVDGAGRLHLASGMNPGGIMYSNWIDGKWSIPEFIPSPSGWAEKSRILVSHGNQAHIFWQEWHTTRTVDAPHRDVMPFPTATPLNVITPFHEPASPVLETEQPLLNLPLDETVNDSGMSSQLSPILVSILPALLIVICILIYTRSVRKN